jgi:alkanesulfonate monooxygenase SsuD/methylene tetrahydromethanopterin reductase-like flavin-dependent oxidoreductase (luciferase family)
VNTPNARQRVIEYCDGWLPIAARAGDLTASVTDLRERAKRAGRDPNSLPVSVFAATPTEDAIRQYQKAGAERAIFPLPSSGRDEILPILDRLAKLTQAFL